MSTLPRPGRSWGIARKLVNIFLRDALYTSYLSQTFQLERAEELLELPLDSITVRRLRSEFGRGHLPRWSGVKHLTEAENLQFQVAAASFAARCSIARVHLDAFWWGVRETEAGGLKRR